MNNTIKILNDAMVTHAQLLEKCLSEHDLCNSADDRETVKMALRDISDALAQVHPDDAGGLTWRFQDDEDACEDGTCKL